MTALTIVLSIILAAFGQAGGDVAPLSSQQVERILQTCATNEKECPRGAIIRQGLMVSLVWATINGPQQRVGFLARDAKRQYKKLSAADVDENVVAPVIAFTVSASRPEKVNDPTHNVEHVFLRKKGAPREDVIRPIREVPIEDVLRNGLGATTTVHDLAAYFNTADIPTGEFDIVAVVDGWRREQTISVKPKDMLKVQ